MQWIRVKWWIILTIFGIVVVSVIVIVRPAERRECPHDWIWDTLPQKGGGPWVPSGRLTGPGPIQNVPEFHDCQRFPVADDARSLIAYDSLFAVFASYRMRRLDTLALADTSVLAQALRARLIGAELDSALQFHFNGLTGREAVPAAEIYAENDYGPLAIRRWFNCLYLYRSNGGWAAKMTNSGAKEVDCSLPVDIAALTGGDLEVHAVAPPPFVQDAYPVPAARWDWNGTEQYIGVTCGAAWCEVGSKGFGQSAAYAVGPGPFGGTIPPSSRVFAIKGWYDQQFLATDPASGGPVRPTLILGTLIPEPELGSHNTIAEFTNKWVPVAQVALDAPAGTDNPYLARLNLSLTTGGRLNTIELCHDGTSSCLPNTVNVPACGDKTWWARITRASNGEQRYTCANRCDIPDVVIPGLVRWRWMAKDEGAWIRCARGCCEVLGDG